MVARLHRMVTPSWFIAPLAVIAALLLWLSRVDWVAGKEGSGGMEVARQIAVFPHSTSDFCQGLSIEGSTVYEGTGHYGSSLLKKYDLITGQVIAQRALHPSYFGEGITVMGDRIYQLTWKERVCLVYDKQTLQPLAQHQYSGQGWGLTNDGKHLYLSDGSAMIQVLDPETLKLIRKIPVAYGRKRQDNLNELEFIQGEIWACVWYEDRIARIDPATGKIKSWLDCSNLYPANKRDRAHVLNGIAYDAQSRRLFVTGKYWPQIFELALPKF